MIIYSMKTNEPRRHTVEVYASAIIALTGLYTEIRKRVSMH